MKIKIITLLACLSVSFLASRQAHAWTEESYERVEDPVHKMKLEDVVAACNDNVDSACNDLLAKLTPKDAFAYEFLATDNFLQKAQTYCTESGSHTCAFLMRKIYEETDKQPNTDAIKAKSFEVALKNCTALADHMKSSQNCIMMIPKFRELYQKSIIERALANPNQAHELLKNVGESQNRQIISKICTEENIGAEVCKPIVQERKELAQRDWEGTKLFLGGIFLIGFIFFMAMTGFKMKKGVPGYNGEAGSSSEGQSNTSDSAFNSSESSNGSSSSSNQTSSLAVVAQYQFDSNQMSEKAFLKIKDSLPRGVNFTGRTVEVTKECSDPGLVAKICKSFGGS